MEQVIERIVVGVDGSAGARRALAWSLEEAELWSATVRAVHAWVMPVMAAPTGLGPMPVLPEVDQMSNGAQQLLDEVVDAAAATHPSVRVERVVAEGGAAEALLEAAKDADLLVLGSRGHGGFVGLLLGSVSQHCTHHALCPVVVVPPPR